MLCASTSLTCQPVAVEIVDHNVGVEYQLGLVRGCQQKPGRANQTYVEEAMGPVEIILQARNCILIALRTNESRDTIAVTLLDDTVLDIGHSSAILPVRESPSLEIACSTHVVRNSIALSAEWLSSSNRRSPNTRLRTSHTRTHSNPRLT